MTVLVPLKGVLKSLKKSLLAITLRRKAWLLECMNNILGLSLQAFIRSTRLSQLVS